MGVCEDGGDQFRAARGAGIASPVDRVVPPRLLAAARNNLLLSQSQRRLHALVQHPLQRRLGHAQVAGAHALVQAAEPFVAQDLPDAVVAVLVLPPRHAAALGSHVLVQLQPRLDHPDRVRRRARHDARQYARAEVHPCALLPVVEVLGDQPLAVAVGEEVDGARGHHADEVGAEALEQRPGAFLPVDRRQDLACLAKVVPGGADGIERHSGVRLSRGFELCLVEIGLESRLKDV